MAPETTSTSHIQTSGSASQNGTVFLGGGSRILRGNVFVMEVMMGLGITAIA